MAGKLGSRYHPTAGISHGSKLSIAYQILEVFSFCAPDRWWGGFRAGTPLYKLRRYVSPHRVGFLRCFGLKTGIDFAHSGLESGMVSRELRDCMNVFIVLIPNE